MKKFRPIGSVYRIDHTNCVAYQDDHEIQVFWQDPLTWVVEAVKNVIDPKNTGVYIRGSVAQGQAVNNVSDLDIFFIKDGDVGMEDSYLKLIDAYVTENWKFVRMCDFRQYNTNDLDENDRFFLKIFSKHLCVLDIIKNFPRPHMGSVQYVHEKIRPDMSLVHKDTLDLLKLSDKKEYPKILKAYLRSMAMPVGRGRGCYTRDLYHCQEMVASAYPPLTSMLAPLANYILDWENPPSYEKLEELILCKKS